MTCNHSYAGGKCILCGSPQPCFNNGKPSNGLSDLSGLKTPPRQPQALKKRVTSEFQMVVDETMTYLGENIQKRGNFAKYCGIIKKIGIENTRIWIKEMKQRGIKSPRYFMKIYGNFNKLK